jgi:hypothetical protein
MEYNIKLGNELDEQQKKIYSHDCPEEQHNLPTKVLMLDISRSSIC